jgi:hypothetical protein
MTSEKMKLEKINIWAIILGLVIILQYFQPTEKNFQDFQGPYQFLDQFPRTFQAWIFFNKFKDFPGFSRTVGTLNMQFSVGYYSKTCLAKYDFNEAVGLVLLIHE